MFAFAASYSQTYICVYIHASQSLPDANTLHFPPRHNIMDQIWKREAEREMSRRFTTPLLPLKLVEGVSFPGPGQPPATQARIVPSSNVRVDTHAKPSRQRYRDIFDYAGIQKPTAIPQSPTNAPGFQVASDLTGSPSRQPPGNQAGATADTRVQVPHRIVKVERSANADSAFSPPSQPREELPPAMREKIARTAANVEESLPYYLGYKRKDAGVRFREQPEIFS